jgi:hypothetical protein
LSHQKANPLTLFRLGHNKRFCRFTSFLTKEKGRNVHAAQQTRAILRETAIGNPAVLLKSYIINVPQMTPPFKRILPLRAKKCIINLYLTHLIGLLNAVFSCCTAVPFIIGPKKKPGFPTRQNPYVPRFFSLCLRFFSGSLSLPTQPLAYARRWLYHKRPCWNCFHRYYRVECSLPGRSWFWLHSRF